jgi:hypothetical protein
MFVLAYPTYVGISTTIYFIITEMYFNVVSLSTYYTVKINTAR